MGKRLIYGLFGFVFFINVSIYAQLNKAVEGKINLLEKDNMITIKAQVENNESFFIENLSYNLLALKKIKAGTYSSNRQSGDFSLVGLEKKDISEIKLNLTVNDELKIYLFIKQLDKLISKDSLIIKSKFERNKSQDVVKEEDFELKGIVIEDVITKIGKDFHDFFYQAYSTSGKKYPFIISIKEKPYFGRSSIVTIEVDDRKIFEFMTKPDEEFLKSSVKRTLQLLSRYAKQRKLLYSNKRI